MRQALIILLTFILSVAVVPVSYGRDNQFSFEEYWRFPLSAQGEVPRKFSELEASLNPDDCGSCHEKQFETWKGSRHNLAMSPGVTGQFFSPWLDRESIRSCTNCHAPLAEQSPTDYMSGGKQKKFNAKLRQQGITCAACHLRKNVRHGPLARSEKTEKTPHNGFVEVNNFGSSLFCKACHQFNNGDNRVAGKLLQNTYNEWKESAYPDKGIECPTCHMPDRKHLWLGIHSPEMVKKGLTISVERKGETLSLVIENSGVGHNFPTYVTPKVVIHGAVIDSNGNELPQTVEESYIGWDIALDLSEEYFDTRIPPGEKFHSTFNLGSSNKGKTYKITITVYPDAFYTSFYEALIDNKPEGIDLKQIKKAHKESQESVYTLYEKMWDI